MTELSFWWTTSGTPAGDQQASYTQVHLATIAKILAACNGFEGVAPGYRSSLVGSVPGANTARIAAGGALVDGRPYDSDGNVDVNIPSTTSDTRIDRIVLKALWGTTFTVRITRIPGVQSSSPVPPSITQTPGTEYDILLYQALVNTGGTVTLTDERVYAAGGSYSVKDNSILLAHMTANSVDSDQYVDGSIDLIHMSANSVDSDQYVDGSIDTAHLADSAVTAIKIANRTRKLFVPALHTDLSTTYSQFGVLLSDGVGAATAYGVFTTPSDFVSGATAKAVVRPLATGNIYAWPAAYYGASGEAYDTHSVVPGYSAVAITYGQYAEIHSLTLTDLAAGDYVWLFYDRYSSHVSDTVNDTVFIIGWLVEYTADS